MLNLNQDNTLLTAILQLQDSVKDSKKIFDSEMEIPTENRYQANTVVYLGL